MRLFRGLDEKAQTNRSDYSIKNIRIEYDTVESSKPPDKTWHKRFRPRLVLELEGSRRYGRKIDKHPARLVIDCDEIEKVMETLMEGLLDSFHTVVENDLFGKTADTKSKR